MLSRIMMRCSRVGAIGAACVVFTACGGSGGEANQSDAQGGDQVETACYSFEVPDGYQVREITTENCYAEAALKSDAGNWFSVAVPAPASGPQVASLAEAVDRVNPQGKQTKITVDGAPAVFAVHRQVPKSKIYSYDLEIFNTKQPYRDPNGHKTGWIKIDFSFNSAHDLAPDGLVDSFIDSFDLK